MWVTPGGACQSREEIALDALFNERSGLTGRTPGTRIGLEPFMGAVLFEMPGESEGVHIFLAGAVL
jgi:hypothetical protein